MAVIQLSHDAYNALRIAREVGQHDSDSEAIRAACEYYAGTKLVEKKSQSARAILEDAVRRKKLLA